MSRNRNDCFSQSYEKRPLTIMSHETPTQRQDPLFKKIVDVLLLLLIQVPTATTYLSFYNAIRMGTRFSAVTSVPIIQVQ